MYRLVYILVYNCTLWKYVQQRQIVEGFDPQVPGCGLETTYNEGKLSISVKTDRRWSKSDQKIGFCGTKYLNPKSWVFLKHPKSINGSPELIFGRSGSNEDSTFASDTSRA